MHMHDDRTWAPTIIGHRGASAHAPENTAPAFDLALAAGATGVEMDLQISRDGQIVIYHDHKLAKLGLRSQHVRDYPWARLATCDAGVWFSPEFAGTPLLSLTEVLSNWGPKAQLLLEIKAHGRNRKGSRDLECARRSAELVAGAPQEVRANVRFLSFSDAVLREVAATFAERGCSPPHLVRNVDHPDALRRTTRDDLNRYGAVCVNVDAFAPDDVARVHRAGLPLYAYTVDKDSQIRHAQKLGCSLLICNGPGEVRQRVEQWGLPPAVFAR